MSTTASATKCIPVGTVAVGTACAILVPLTILVILFNFGHWLIPGCPRNRKRLLLQGKTVLLTGASSGIGREMARQMHAKGAKLILASRSTEQLEALCTELDQQQQQSNQKLLLHKPVYVRLDLEEVANDKAKLLAFVSNVQHLLASESAKDGGQECVAGDNQNNGVAVNLDVLVNNAGQMAYGSGRHTGMEVLRRMLDVNYLGHVAITQALMDQIPGDGAIVVLGSIAGRVGLPYLGAYCAAKHALQGFFDSLRAEHRPQLQILTVSAGYVNTELGPNALNEQGGQLGQRDPGQVEGMSAEYAAREIVSALEGRKTELLLAPFKPRFMLSMRLFTPNLLWHFLHRNFACMYEHVGRCRAPEE